MAEGKSSFSFLSGQNEQSCTLCSCGCPEITSFTEKKMPTLSHDVDPDI